MINLNVKYNYFEKTEGLFTPSPPLPLPQQEVRHDESSILIDEQDKMIEPDHSKEASEKPENSQSLRPNLIEANNTQIEIHQLSEILANKSLVNGSEGFWGRVKEWTTILSL